MNDLLAEIDHAIVEEEELRGKLMFDLGRCAGRIEMAKAIRVKLIAAEPPAPPNKEVDDDAGEEAEK